MNELLLDGREMTTPEAFHAALQAGLELPDYYGCNLDALWDALTGQVALPLCIHWHSFWHAQRVLGRYAWRALWLMRKAARETPGLTLVVRL